MRGHHCEPFDSYANITPPSVRGSRAKAPLETMVLPTVYDPPLRRLPSAAINVAAVYAQCQ